MGYVARGTVAVLLATVVLKESVAYEEAIGSFELNVLYVVFGAFALVAVAWTRWELPPEHGLASREGAVAVAKLGGIAVATAGLLALMNALNGPGIPEGIRGVTIAAVFLLVVAYPFLHDDAADLLRRNWPYLLAFAVLWGAYLSHGAARPAGSAIAAFPMAVGFLLVVNLFVLPRYVAIDDFLWAVSRISAVLLGLGMLAYLVGEFTLLGLPFQLWGTSFSPRLLPVQIPLLQSVFVNPNGTGVLAFVGTSAALVELHRGADRWLSEADGETSIAGPLTVVVPAVLLLVNGLGLYLTHSRASLLAAALAGGLYLAAAVVGRDVLPYATFATAGLVFAALVAIGTGLVAVNTGGRFVLWSAGIEAILRDPALLGRGIVDTGEVIAPYVSDDSFAGTGVHNSYLTTTIRAGLLGGAAHVVLVVGSLVHGLLGGRRVDAATIAVGFGFAVHQLFESYTVYQHSMGAVLASLVVGYVIARPRRGGGQPAESETEDLADVFGRRDWRALLE